MSNLFADTSGWGHLVDATQFYHSLAATFYRTTRRQGFKIITTNYVITEITALMTSPLRTPRKTIVSFIESLKTSSYVKILHVDQTLDEQAWQLFKERQDKEWSLVDCASFVVMKRLGLTKALTTDHHFEQAGYVALLKS